MTAALRRGRVAGRPDAAATRPAPSAISRSRWQPRGVHRRVVAAPGKVHSLASTQWAYNGWNGIVSTIRQAHVPSWVRRRCPPTAKDRGPESRDQSAERTASTLINTRMPECRSPTFERYPSSRPRPTCCGTSRAWRIRTLCCRTMAWLCSSTMATTSAHSPPPVQQNTITTHRSSRRPWLETIPALKRTQWRIHRVEVVLPSHYHDDHVAGFNLLRHVEGTEVWSPENMTRTFHKPGLFDLPVSGTTRLCRPRAGLRRAGALA